MEEDDLFVPGNPTTHSRTFCEYLEKSVGTKTVSNMLFIPTVIGKIQPEYYPICYISTYLLRK